MSNPLFNTLGGTLPAAEDNGLGAMLQQLQAFKNSFRGDARAEVQRLLSTGQMTQQQFNEYAQMANRISALFK